MQDNKKSWFPWKTTIAVVLAFGLLKAGMFLYPPLRIRWYESKLQLKEGREFNTAVKKLLSLGPRGQEIVQRYFEGNDTGWGKPKNGLIVKISPGKVRIIKKKDKIEMFFAIMNISGHPVRISTEVADVEFDIIGDIEDRNIGYLPYEIAFDESWPPGKINLLPGQACPIEFYLEVEHLVHMDDYDSIGVLPVLGPDKFSEINVEGLRIGCDLKGSITSKLIFRFMEVEALESSLIEVFTKLKKSDK
jgi:hypothetical protein